jgi:hypothetical protein
VRSGPATIFSIHEFREYHGKRKRDWRHSLNKVVDDSKKHLGFYGFAHHGNCARFPGSLRNIARSVPTKTTPRKIQARGQRIGVFGQFGIHVVAGLSALGKDVSNGTIQTRIVKATRSDTDYLGALRRAD